MLGELMEEPWPVPSKTGTWWRMRWLRTKGRAVGFERGR